MKEDFDKSIDLTNISSARALADAYKQVEQINSERMKIALEGSRKNNCKNAGS